MPDLVLCAKNGEYKVICCRLHENQGCDVMKKAGGGSHDTTVMLLTTDG